MAHLTKNAKQTKMRTLELEPKWLESNWETLAQWQRGANWCKRLDSLQTQREVGGHVVPGRAWHDTSSGTLDFPRNISHPIQTSGGAQVPLTLAEEGALGAQSRRSAHKYFQSVLVSRSNNRGLQRQSPCGKFTPSKPIIKEHLKPILQLLSGHLSSPTRAGQQHAGQQEEEFPPSLV